MKNKKLLILIIFMLILPSFYINNIIFNNIYQINIYVENGYKSISASENYAIIVSQIENDKSALLNTIQNYGCDNKASIFKGFKIIDIYNQSSLYNNTYNIRVEKDDIIYHITIVISAVGGRLEGINVFENEKRRKIFEYILNNPGSYVREIMRAQDLTPNEAQYHLATLERHNIIKQYRSGKYLLYYPNNKDINIKQIELNLINRNINYKKIYNIKLINNNISIKELSIQTGLHRNTISKYMKILNNNINI